MVNIDFGRLDGIITDSIGIDAVPKKRGPKTDVLEALLKRVDGLERRLKDEKKSRSTPSPSNGNGSSAEDDNSNGESSQRPQQDTSVADTKEVSGVYSTTPIR
jgi:hypothetical protein